MTDRNSDGNIRYFEYENDKFEFLSEYKSGDPQRGLAFMPKRGVNIHQNEVVRIYKSISDSYIEPISFIVPRRSEVFQDDIYPPTTGSKPAMSASEWQEGKEAVPPKISLEGLYDGTGVKEVAPSQAKPTSTISAAAPTPAEPVKAAVAEPVRAEPTPVVRPAPSMKDQGASMAAMVDKFADDEEKEEEIDDTSSFEEVTKPVERTTTAPPVAKVEPSPVKEKEVTTPVASTPVISAPTTTTEKSAAPLFTAQDDLAEIKALIAQQTRTIASQAEQMQNLTAEIESLKAKLGN